MKYRELLDEYRALLNSEIKLQTELCEIPKGYLVTKRISGKEYLYLQYTEQGKKKTEYIREEDQERYQIAILRREPAKEEIKTIRQEQTRLESAAKILDSNLFRCFVFLKQCAQMDAMPMGKRQDALSFAKAMTALEGLPTREETEHNLLLWSKGEKKFEDIYLKSLQSYNVLEGMQ